jgi:glycosyltransferase involved in cell wall biosynthesis
MTTTPRVLLVHNRYRQPGGEDAVFAAEAALLRAAGHEVVEFTDDNARARDWSGARLAAATIWSREATRRLRELLARERPDVAHFHNTFQLISPAAYRACRAARVPVVQTLHNYRLLCPAATCYRAGRACEDCVGRAPWPAIRHGCYRDSRAASAAVAAMLVVHRLLGTFADGVDVYVALSEFARARYVAGGLPARRIELKPNFVAPDPGAGPGGGGYALFVGRLAPEKGIATLLAAWRRIGTRLPLRIAGDGPLAPQVREAAASGSSVDWLGQRTGAEVIALMQRAELLVLPSEWYENLPVTLIEAFACGLPVVASRIGALATLVPEGRAGRLFAPGDPAALADAALALVARPAELARLRAGARAEYLARYTAEANYRRLREIYARALAARG